MVNIKIDYKLEEHPDKTLEELEMLVNKRNQLRLQGKTEEEIKEILQEKED